MIIIINLLVKILDLFFKIGKIEGKALCNMRNQNKIKKETF